MEKSKSFHCAQLLPDSSEVAEREPDRLLHGFGGFRSSGMPGVFLTEVLQPRMDEYNEPRFDISRASEMIGLLDKATFGVVCKAKLPKDVKSLGGRLLIAIKNSETNEPANNSRFVVQCHNDPEKQMVIYSAKTIFQNSVRVLIAIAIVCRFTIWSQVVSPAYLRTAEGLIRELYMRATEELKLQLGQLLKIR